MQPQGPAVLDLNAITPDMMYAAGMNPQRFEREMMNAPQIPITQEDRDKLGRIRNSRLRIVKISSVVMLITSIVSIILGIITISVTSEFPYAIGGGLVAGIPCFFLALIGLWMVAEGGKTPTGDVTTNCFTHIMKCHLISVFIFGTFIMTAWGIAGVWGTVDCATRQPSDDTNRWTINSCAPNTSTLLALSVLTLLIISALFIMYNATCCAYFCQMRAFGIKSGYERLLDIQQARMAEMHRVQQQQVQQQQPQPVNMYSGAPMGGQMMPGQYYQGQGNQYQPHVGDPLLHPQPSAPPPTGYTDRYPTKNDDPPSYNEVMNP